MVPLACTHGVLGRDAQLAAVVGLGDGEARVLGREEEVAFGRGAGKAPDEVAVGRNVGVLGQIDVQGDGIAAVEGCDDVAEVFADGRRRHRGQVLLPGRGWQCGRRRRR